MTFFALARTGQRLLLFLSTDDEQMNRRSIHLRLGRTRMPDASRGSTTGPLEKLTGEEIWRLRQPAPPEGFVHWREPEDARPGEAGGNEIHSGCEIVVMRTPGTSVSGVFV